jgi:hypothetical protein
MMWFVGIAAHAAPGGLSSAPPGDRVPCGRVPTGDRDMPNGRVPTGDRDMPNGRVPTGDNDVPGAPVPADGDARDGPVGTGGGDEHQQ